MNNNIPFMVWQDGDDSMNTHVQNERERGSTDRRHCLRVLCCVHSKFMSKASNSINMYLQYMVDYLPSLVTKPVDHELSANQSHPRWCCDLSSHKFYDHLTKGIILFFYPYETAFNKGDFIQLHFLDIIKVDRSSVIR